MPIHFRPALILLSALLLALSLSANARVSVDIYTKDDISAWFPQATTIDPTVHKPGYRLIYNNDQIIGALLLTSDINPIPAYSGKPITVLIGLATDNRIIGAKIVDHEEPILVVGIKEQDLTRFSDQYSGFSSLDNVRVNAFDRPGYVGVDGITGATITAMVLNRSIMTSAQKVTETLGWPLKDPTVKHTPPPEQEPTLEQRWQQRLDTWQGQEAKIWGILLALSVLTLIMFFQDWLVRRPRLFKPLRHGFLIFTVVFIGYVFSAQLSIVNVLAFIQTYTLGFTWDTLMIDPGIFFLWGFVAISILLWGRGVFCGWLCPFGAMQELIHELAQKLKIPTFEFPPLVHERLWAIKYLVLIVLVGISMDSFSFAAKLAEIEPFKTTLTMKFAREWGYVVYAAGLLAIAAVNSKFYCKYLCALGASLSILSRFKIFDWLRRRNECGKPCQSCAAKCQINAIKPTGEIIDSECHYCFDCQLKYWDDHTCPPLIEKRKKREKREKRSRLIEVVEISVQTDENPRIF
jgi:polyferredoxin